MIEMFVGESTRLIPQEEFEREHRNLTDFLVISPMPYYEEKVVFDGMDYYRKSWAGNHVLNCVYIYVGKTPAEVYEWEARYNKWSNQK